MGKVKGHSTLIYGPGQWLSSRPRSGSRGWPRGEGERGQARLKGRWGGNAEEREGLRKSMIRDRREQHRKRRESARLGVLFIHVSARWC